jgi:hypothetical protein
MHLTNPTEMFPEHHLALLREAESLHHHLRAASEAELERRMFQRHPETVAVSEPPEESWLQILWSTGPVL